MTLGGVPGKLIARMGWATGSYMVAQGLRLATNVILARLLAPDLFGVMLIVNTVRFGIELLSDIGVGQNIVRHADGEDPDFYDTAWTLQVIRGVFLAVLCLLLAHPVSAWFESPVLAQIMPVASFFFLFAGCESVGRFIIQKRVDLRTFAIFDVATAAFSTVAHIVLALISPTIWALVFGGLLSSAAIMIGTYFFVPGMRHRFMLARPQLGEILSFGKWVYLSTAVYFLAMNFDRLYLAKTVTLTALGVYGVARSLADVIALFMSRLGNIVIFPLVASASTAGEDVRLKLARNRPRFLLATAVGTACFFAGAEPAVRILYDARYHDAALYLPVMIFGVWFAVLNTMNEAVLMGTGRPAYAALGNVAKLGWLAIALPLGVAWNGIAGAVLALALAEAVRYGPLWIGQKRAHLSFARQDVGLTLAMLAVAVLAATLTAQLGLSTGLGPLLAFFTPTGR